MMNNPLAIDDLWVAPNTVIIIVILGIGIGTYISYKNGKPANL